MAGFTSYDALLVRGAGRVHHHADGSGDLAMSRPSNWPKGRRHKPRRGRPLTDAQKAKVLRRYPTCWFRTPGVCTTTSEEVHHLTEVEDGGTNDPENLVGACHACHERHSAQESQKRAVRAATEWKRKPERHPGVLD